MIVRPCLLLVLNPRLFFISDAALGDGGALFIFSLQASSAWARTVWEGLVELLRRLVTDFDRIWRTIK